MKHKGPISSLRIPNKLYLLWDRRNKLQRKLGASVLKYTVMALRARFSALKLMKILSSQD